MMTPQQYQHARRAMLTYQLLRRGIDDERVLAAFDATPRERFVPPEAADEAYADRALQIAGGQTISQPYMVGLMTQALQVGENDKVLEIGTGSGYQAAILSLLAREVISLERLPELSRQAAGTLQDLSRDNVRLVVADGSRGWPPEAPYDRIIVTAAAASCPAALLDQLADGGLLVIPLGGGECQTLQVLRKRGGQILATDVCQCRFVPLIAD